MAYPLLFSPVYKDYIWGGERIRRFYGRDIPADICAESWELSDRPEGMSMVSNGSLAGRSLHELLLNSGAGLVGSRQRAPRVFPLLIKIIDAAQRLSVQVHPDDDSAALEGAEAKTEMWYILHAEPGSRVFAGVKAGVGPAEFREALEEERLEEVLNSVPVEAGSAIFTPGGRVHAIGEGCLLLEVQQNSNTTYRVYDWGRVGHDGKPRPLHLEEAMRVIRWNEDAPVLLRPEQFASANGNRIERIVHCEHFVVERIELRGPETVLNDGRSFHALFVESGAIFVQGGDQAERLERGTSCLLPAALESYAIAPADDWATVIRSRLPE